MRLTVLALAIAASAVAAGNVLIAAEASERFTFAAADAPKTGIPGEERLEVTIDRWSTDAERDRFATALADPEVSSRKYVFRDLEGVGFVRWPAGLQYTVRYARRTPRSDGGADLTLVVDSPVWVWWNTSATIPIDEPFTVVRVTIDRNGVGQGTLVPASKVRTDKALGLQVTDDADRPVLLTDFRAQRG